MFSFFVRSKFLHYSLIAVFLLYTSHGAVLAQGDEDTYVTNIRVERQGKINIFIEYDIDGPADDLYTVTLTIKSKSDSSYAYTPLNVIGDIGGNIHAGKNKRISWRVSDEYPAILSSTDVQFVIKAIPPESAGSNTELFIAGGTAVVGLALAIVFLSSNKAQPGQVNNVFPQPPGRP